MMTLTDLWPYLHVPTHTWRFMTRSLGPHAGTCTDCFKGAPSCLCASILVCSSIWWTNKEKQGCFWIERNFVSLHKKDPLLSFETKDFCVEQLKKKKTKTTPKNQQLYFLKDAPDVNNRNENERITWSCNPNTEVVWRVLILFRLGTLKAWQVANE